MNFKNLIAWPLARLFYYAGDYVCNTLDKYIEISEEYFFLDQCEDEYVWWLYSLYSGLMNISVSVDDWGVTKLWSWSEPVTLTTYE